MKKLLLLGIALLPAVSLAAPSGTQICRDNTKNIELTYGTYALGYDGAELKVNGVRHSLSVNPGEGAGDVYQLMIPMCFCAPIPGERVGSAQWDLLEGDYDTAKSIKLTVDMNGLHLKDAVLQCETLEFRSGNEQN
jgi:hypothetical protein